MNKQIFDFLKAVLGQDGATAMRKAVARDPRIEYFLVPRTALGWALSKTEYEGQVPGTEIYVNFKKTSDTFTGVIAHNGQPAREFSGDQYTLAADITAGLGYEVGTFEGTDKLLATLGKSIDTLLKAQFWTNKLKKGAVDLPGTTHKPTQQTGPEEPQKPIAVQPSNKTKPKLPKLPMLKVNKEDLHKSCKTCAGVQFKENKFTGCICWRDLAKHTSTTMYSDGAVVEFSKSADRAAVHAFFKELMPHK